MFSMGAMNDAVSKCLKRATYGEATILWADLDLPLPQCLCAYRPNQSLGIPGAVRMV